jgi:hypothetical protein
MPSELPVAAIKAPAGFERTAVGLRLADDWTFEQWQEAGRWLKQCDGAIHWWIGDWLNYGERRYGEKYAKAAEATGFDYQTLVNDRNVAAKIEINRRRLNLSWSHHAEVAALPPDEQDALLAEAEAEGLSRGELRQRARRKRLEVTPADVCDSATGEWWRVECADCLEFLARQEPGSIDLIFGSPPYEDARLYLEGGADLGVARATEAWVAWMVEVYRASLRACKGLVAFVVAGRTRDYRWSASPALLMAALDGERIALRAPPIYQRVGIPGSGGPDWLRNDYEFVVCATNGGPLPWSDNTAMGKPPKYEPGGAPSHRTVDDSRVGDTGRGYQPPDIANPGNVIECVVGGGAMGSKLAHENEAPFPESLAEFFIRSFCPPGGLVCDPFAGSGTTLAAALQCGRRATGCDLRASQIAIAKRRLRGVTPRYLNLGEVR